jgi:hypothetical protein
MVDSYFFTSLYILSQKCGVGFVPQKTHSLVKCFHYVSVFIDCVKLLSLFFPRYILANVPVVYLQQNSTNPWFSGPNLTLLMVSYS